MSDSSITTNPQIISYGLGRQMGTELHRNQIDGIELELVIKGLQDAYNGEASPVSNDQFQAAFTELQETMQAKAAAAHEEAIQAGKQYLENNAKRDAVQVTDSGLQYEILTAGTGEKPTADSVVRTHYHGTFVDGNVFDSSVQRGEPAEFPVGGVIAGWTEALQMMPTGSKWRLTVPSNLAYGEQGAGGSIPPHATLIFEVELLDIV